MGTTAIRTEGLTKRYDDVAALDDLDLEVAQGEVVGFLGPNGAGKTTTIRLLLGLIQPTAGHGSIFGYDCQRQPIEAHRHLAFVAGEANLWPSLTGAETLHLLGRIQGQMDDGLSGRIDRSIRSRSQQEGPRLLQGKSPEGRPDRRSDGSARPAFARRTDQWARSTRWSRHFAVASMKRVTAARRSFSRPTS